MLSAVQVRNFFLNNDLGDYADAVLAFGADTPQRLHALTVRLLLLSRPRYARRVEWVFSHH
jgi:hypothetical protein